MDFEIIAFLVAIGILTWGILTRIQNRTKQPKESSLSKASSQYSSREYASNIRSYSNERIDIMVKGIWAEKSRIQAFHALEYDDILYLEFDPYNPYDKNAIAVKSKSGDMLGYIERNRRKVIKTLKENPNNLAFIIEKDQFHRISNSNEYTLY